MAKTNDIKKKETKTKPKQQANRVPQRQTKGISRIIKETRGELRKVSWPTRTEALNLTKIVLIVLLVMSAFLGTLDTLFLKFFKLVLFS
ncbi:MAG: preprotein translocase subunit SecE [Anaerolineales bacterium]|nr:preprotein translocase subunit SecE [Anaerolineales bacterium]